MRFRQPEEAQRSPINNIKKKNIIFILSAFDILQIKLYQHLRT